MRQCLTRSLYNIWCRSPGRVQASLEVEEDSAVVSAVVSAEDSVENSVWHAFEYMALEGDGTVPKTKLKVGSETKSGSSYFPS